MDIKDVYVYAEERVVSVKRLGSVVGMANPRLMWKKKLVSSARF